MQTWNRSHSTTKTTSPQRLPGFEEREQRPCVPIVTRLRELLVPWMITTSPVESYFLESCLTRPSTTSAATVLQHENSRVLSRDLLTVWLPKGLVLLLRRATDNPQTMCASSTLYYRESEDCDLCSWGLEVLFSHISGNPVTHAVPDEMFYLSSLGAGCVSSSHFQKNAYSIFKLYPWNDWYREVGFCDS